MESHNSFKIKLEKVKNLFSQLTNVSQEIYVLHDRSNRKLDSVRASANESNAKVDDNQSLETNLAQNTCHESMDSEFTSNGERLCVTHGAEKFDYAPGVQETTCQFHSIRASNAKFDDNQYSEARFEPATINTIHEPFGQETTFNGNGVRPEMGKFNYVQGLHEQIWKLDSMRVIANKSSAKFDDNQNMVTNCNPVKHNLANAFNRELISSGNVTHGAEKFDYAPGVQETTCQFHSIRASNAKFDDNQHSRAKFEPAPINTIHEPFGRKITFNGNGVRPETGKFNYVQWLHEQISKLDSMRVTTNKSSAKFDDNQNMATSCNPVKYNMANAFNREFISSGNAEFDIHIVTEQQNNEEDDEWIDVGCEEMEQQTNEKNVYTACMDFGVMHETVNLTGNLNIGLKHRSAATRSKADAFQIGRKRYPNLLRPARFVYKNETVVSFPNRMKSDVLKQNIDDEDNEWIDIEESPQQMNGKCNVELNDGNVAPLASHVAQTVAKTVANLKDLFSGTNGLGLSEARSQPESFKIERQYGCDKTKMFLPTSDVKMKKLCCMYCRIQYAKLARHLRFVHKNESAVKEFLAFAPGSKRRRDIIAAIRKEGEFVWNSDIKLNKGVLQTSRRPNKKFGTNPFRRIACSNCMGTYSPNTLSSHWRKCTGKSIKGERMVKELGRTLEGRIHAEASKELNDIFARLRDDEPIRMIQFDWLIACYGNELCINYSPHYQEGYIRSKLRSAGKVLQFSKEISPNITDLSSLFHVKNCRTVIEAIRRMGKFNRQTNLFGSPGTASTTVTLINALGERLIVESMLLDDEEKERNAERFLKVFQKEVKTKINKLVAITKAKNRRHKKLNLPSIADIAKLSEFLDTEREACYNELTEEFSYQTWLRLAQLTLVTILLFNRRRAGEMRNIIVTDFSEREFLADQPDMLLETISKEMREEIKSRMHIRGKLDRTVPVLLKHSWDDCVELLIRFRESIGIPESNEFLFATPTHTMRVKTVNVWVAINSFAKACGAENPSSLSPTAS